MSPSRPQLNILPFIFKSIFPAAWRTSCKALTHTEVLCLFFLSLTTVQSLLLHFHPPVRILLLHKLHHSPAITLFLNNFMGPVHRLWALTVRCSHSVTPRYKKKMLVERQWKIPTGTTSAWIQGYLNGKESHFVMKEEVWNEARSFHAAYGKLFSFLCVYMSHTQTCVPVCIWNGEMLHHTHSTPTKQIKRTISYLALAVPNHETIIGKPTYLGFIFVGYLIYTMRWLNWKVF